METVASFFQFNKDFQDWVNDKKIVIMEVFGKEKDVYVVTPSRIYNQETMKLNREVFNRHQF